jgi:hypothetical protein
MQKNRVLQVVDLPRVVGTGVLYKNGTRFCTVSSVSEPGRVHVVEYLDRGFGCDCKGYRRWGHCSHIDAVLALLQQVRENELAERKAARAKRTASSRAGSKSGQDIVSHAPPASREAHRASCSHPGDTAIPRRSNKPFSLLK